MAKVTIDVSTCVGCGLCDQNCPNVFEFKDYVLASVMKFSVPACDFKVTVEQFPLSCFTV